MVASRKAEEFCRSHQGSSRLSTHLALCVEEMGTNIVTYGFKEEKKNHLAIRLQHKDGRWILRFRDDCMAFDPVSHVSKNDDSSDSVGIRLAMRMADEARYTYSMNLNNLTLVLREIPHNTAARAPGDVPKWTGRANFTQSR
jgi:anti-sigma regulatory factor (Ser/Thr protein kinase)